MAEKKVTNKKSKPVSPDIEENLSIIQRIINLFKDNSPEGKKKQLLKDIGKILKKAKYKFINVKTEEALPALAKFYHQIYCVTAVPAKFLAGQEKTPSLKALFIDSVLSEKQKELINRLDKEGVEKRLSDNSSEVESVKKELAALVQSVSPEQIEKANGIYKQYLIFVGLLKYDYYYFLKKFDASIPEMDLKYKPLFKSVDCEYVVDDLIEIASMFPLLLSYSSWNEVFDVLKTFKHQDVITRDDWTKLTRYIGNVASSEVFKYMIRFALKDPYYTVPFDEPKENIFDEYFTKLKTSVEMVIQKIAIDKKNSKKDELVKQVFGDSTAGNRMKNYTEANNGVFKQKLLGGYLYIEGVSYVKTFMLDYVKKDVMKVVNFLLVKAEWKTNASSKELSDSLAALMSLSDKIIQLDNSLGPDGGPGSLGSKIASYMKRMGADPKCKVEIKKLLSEINNAFALTCQEVYKNMTKIAQALADILPEFVDKPPMAIIINPPAVKAAYEKAGEGDVVEDIKTVYKKIYVFLNLMKTIFGG